MLSGRFSVNSDKPAKKLQSDNLTILDVELKFGHSTSKLQKLPDMPIIIGGWEETLANSLAESDCNTLHGQQLWTKAKRTGPSNKYVTTNRDFSAIRNDTVQSLMNLWLPD